jgi:hypothetical protein
MREGRPKIPLLGKIRASRGRDITIERRRGHPEAVRDLGHADVGIGQHRLGGLDVVVCEFRRTASGAASAPRGGEARLGTLPDQAAFEFRHVKDQPPLRGCRVEGFGQAAKPDASHPQGFDGFNQLLHRFIDRAKRSSFHTISVSPLRANSSRRYHI